MPLFGHSLFGQSEWQSFASAVRLRHENDQEPQSVLLQRAAPEISRAMYSTREALLHVGAANHSAIQQQLLTLITNVNALASSSISISLPCELTGRFTQSITQSITQPIMEPMPMSQARALSFIYLGIIIYL